MRKFVVDGMLSGTGIRDMDQGGYVKPAELGVPEGIADELSRWLSKYEEQHYFDFADSEAVAALDREGVVLAERLQETLPQFKFGYYSNGLLKHLV